MIKFIFIFLMGFSFAVSATELEDCNDPLLDIQCIQLTWSPAELREDGTAIEAREKYNLYHTYGTTLLPTIEVLESATSYLAFNVGVGSHAFQISTVEAGQEGEKSDPLTAVVLAPEIEVIAPPQKITISGNNLIIEVIK